MSRIRISCVTSVVPFACRLERRGQLPFTLAGHDSPPDHPRLYAFGRPSFSLNFLACLASLICSGDRCRIKMALLFPPDFSDPNTVPYDQRRCSLFH